MQKHGRRVVRPVIGLIVCVTAIGNAACGSTSDSAQPSDGSPSVSITSPADKSALPGNVLTLDLRPIGVEIAKADGSTSPARGHFHVFIDKDPPAVGTAIPKGPGIIHTTETQLVIPGLSAGFHHIAVVIGDGAHKRTSSSVAELSVLMEGPSVTAKAPAMVTEGDPVPITLTVSGVEIVKADGDTSGKSGHFHLFVDRPPVKPGEVISKEPDIIHTAATTVDVPDLPIGVHTIWVVLGDGAHRAWSPAVEAKVMVTVEAAPPPPPA